MFGIKLYVKNHIIVSKKHYKNQKKFGVEIDSFPAQCTLKKPFKKNG